MAKRDPATNSAFSREFRKDLRRKGAQERQKYWSGLTLAKQLEALDLRLEEGQGAVKQRARIAKSMEEDKLPSKKKKRGVK